MYMSSFRGGMRIRIGETITAPQAALWRRVGEMVG